MDIFTTVFFAVAILVLILLIVLARHTRATPWVATGITSVAQIIALGFSAPIVMFATLGNEGSLVITLLAINLGYLIHNIYFVYRVFRDYSKNKRPISPAWPDELFRP